MRNRASRAEQHVAKSLRSLLSLASVGAFDNELDYVARRLREGELDEEVTALRSVLGGFEFYIPWVLRQENAFWEKESLDGFAIIKVRRIGEWGFECSGLCQLITDMTWTPVELSLRLSPDKDEIEWFKCRLGEVGSGSGELTRMRIPHRPWGGVRPSIRSDLAARWDKIHWVFEFERSPT